MKSLILIQSSVSLTESLTPEIGIFGAICVSALLMVGALACWSRPVAEKNKELTEVRYD